MFRRLVCITSTVALALLVSGCSPSQNDIEKSIRDGMKTNLGVRVSSLDLKKQADGSYAGTAVAQNNEVYDVTTTPVKDNKVEWKAIPGQATVERKVREGLEQQLSTKVKTLQITKIGPGNYTGSAELATGAKVNIKTHMEGQQLMWEAQPATP